MIAKSDIKVRTGSSLSEPHPIALIQVGDVLFSELPFCSVLLPDQYASHCHHCQLPLGEPVPCLECTQTRYCGDECRQRSWDDYHRLECGGLDLLNSVGVAHLALRAVLVGGRETIREIRSVRDHFMLLPQIRTNSLFQAVCGQKDADAANFLNYRWCEAVRYFYYVSGLIFLPFR